MRPLTTLWLSLTHPPVYRAQSQKPGWQVFGYTLFWYFLFSLILTAYLHLHFFSGITAALNLALDHLTDTYPAALVLTVSDSKLQVDGAPTPVYLTLPPNPLLVYPNLAVIDPNQTPEALTAQDTYLGASAMALGLNFPGQAAPLIIPYDQLALSGTLTATHAAGLIAQTQTALNQISPLFTGLILFLSLLIALLPARLIYALITALILTFFAAFNRVPYRFPHFAKISLTALVAADAVNLTTTLIYGQPTPLVFNLGFLGFTSVAVYTLLKSISLKSGK